ncbi:hypothetical protein ACA910_009696 [Epithemia clementina (nom. ined.)]
MTGQQVSVDTASISAGDSAKQSLLDLYPTICVDSSSASTATCSTSSSCACQGNKSFVIETTTAALFDMNAAGVACMFEAREDEALQFFEQGLSVCGVYVRYLFVQNPAILSRFSSKLSAQGSLSVKEELDCLILPATCDLALQSIDPVSKSRRRRAYEKNRSRSNDCLQHRTQQAPFTLYERPLVFGNAFNTGSSSESLKAAYNHIAPVLLYNLGLLVHQRAVTSADCYLAHELYRLSLFLMEENTIQGIYDQGFDILLLALFNNLGELNGSFYQHEQYALCREKLLVVFLNADLAKIRGDDYAFFYEQLVFSVDGHNAAAPAA